MKLDLPPEKKRQAKWLHNWSFSPVVPESYQVLGEMLDETLPLYSSKLFNADCDETWDLGLGRSKQLCARRGTGRVYIDHLLKLHRMAAERGKRMMVWCDIILRHPEFIKTLPKNLLALDWGYDAFKDRRKTVRQFARAGLEFWVCPGVGTWSSVFARTDVAQENIRKFAEAGRQYGATGLLNTDWGDGGHPNLQGHSLHGYACGAEQSWSTGKAGDGDFDARFSWAVFRDGSGRFGRLYRALGRTNRPFGKDQPYDYASYPFRMLWNSFRKPLDVRQPPTEAELRQAEGRAREALELIAGLRPAFRSARQTLDECELAARQTLAGCRRGRIFAAAHAAIKGQARLSTRQRSELKQLRAEWRGFRHEFERLWLARSKRSQISYRLGLYDRLDREYGKLIGQR
jgi:hypothetical protein